MTNTINTQKANAPTNGNCKAVRDITNNIRYSSMTEAAMANGVRLSSMSYAISHDGLCNGNHFVLESELYKSGDKLCAENAKANARATKANERAKKAEAQIVAMEDEMAEFRQWKAEKEAKRKAEEEHNKAVAKAEEKVTKWNTECERREARLKVAMDNLTIAKRELAALKAKKVTA